MKKFAVICFISMISSAAFAADGAVLDRVLARTDAGLASMASRAAADIQVPEPSRASFAAAPAGVRLTDITDKCSKDGEVLSSYPEVYAKVPKDENMLVLKVFRFTARDGAERRIEVLLTGGDWMQYALIYVITNAGPDKNTANAYFMPRLSTPDKEEGAVAPEVDPHDAQKLVSFLTGEFLDLRGNVKPGFTSVAAATR